MSIEDRLPTRENPSPAQSQGDATVRRQGGADKIENRETDTDVPNKEIAKKSLTVTDNNGVPVSNPEEQTEVADGNAAQSDG